MNYIEMTDTKSVNRKLYWQMICKNCVDCVVKSHIVSVNSDITHFSSLAIVFSASEQSGNNPRATFCNSLVFCSCHIYAWVGSVLHHSLLDIQGKC
jgi:hypothetical protein